MVTSIPFLIARITDDNDFLKLKEMANVHESWTLVYDRHQLKIWSKPVDDATVKMVKVWAVFEGISSTELYCTLLDPLYRKEWDNHTIIEYEIGYLNHNNIVSYYAASCPPPLKSRDFVLQSSWLDRNSEQFILNHSICHKDHPPRQGFIRAVSYFTGYYLRSIINEGCEITFVSQTDFLGLIPAWLINKCTQILAPKIIKQLEKAASAYSEWKSRNHPNYLPWIHQEQRKAPQIPITDCVPSEEEKQSSFYKYLLQKNLKQVPIPHPSFEDVIPDTVKSESLIISNPSEAFTVSAIHSSDIKDSSSSTMSKDIKEEGNHKINEVIRLCA